MSRPTQRLRVTLSVWVALALAAPASSLAGESPAGAPPAAAAAPTGAAPVAPAPGAPVGPASPAPVPSTPTSTGAPAPPSPPSTSTASEPAAPQVAGQLSQGASRGGTPASSRSSTPKGTSSAPGGAGEGGAAAAARAKLKAVSPSLLTPALPFALRSSLGGLPGFFIDSFQVPPFLLPIYQAAGTAYGIPWQVLAAINEVETDYGRDLSVSSAGAEGWMQFLPAEWAQYGVDANGDGFKDPYNPADAIFAAARYLRAAGGEGDIRGAVFSYNHSQAYVETVMLRAQLLGGTPAELLGAITGLTEARFPVHAAARFSDGFQTVPPSGSAPARTLVGTTVYAAAGSPVIAVQDGQVVQIGSSPELGRFLVLRDAFANSYVYAQLGVLASVYPVLQPHVQSVVSSRIGQPGARPEPRPNGPATAGAQPRSPVSEGATISGLALGAASGLESAPGPAHTPTSAPPPPSPPPARAHVKVFREGVNDVYLHPLAVGAQVIAGTVLGHLGGPSATAGISDAASPHILFQIRPAGLGAPLIDPKPILDGWVALENTSIFKARGENPFLATSPTIGQVLLESKQQLEPQVLHDGGIRLTRCARQDVAAGRVDKRVLAMLEYLSVSGLKPSVSGLACAAPTSAALAANVPAASASEGIQITAVNGVPVAGHQGQGSIADTTVRKLLMLQGISRPKRILSLMSYPGTSVAAVSQSAARAIGVAFSAPDRGAAHAASALGATLSPSQWIKLTARLGEIPDPTVGSAPSSAAIPVAPSAGASRSEGGAGGNG